jgi:hypothetical protein
LIEVKSGEAQKHCVLPCFEVRDDSGRRAVNLCGLRFVGVAHSSEATPNGEIGCVPWPCIPARSFPRA